MVLLQLSSEAMLSTRETLCASPHIKAKINIHLLTAEPPHQPSVPFYGRMTQLQRQITFCLPSCNLMNMGHFHFLLLIIQLCIHSLCISLQSQGLTEPRMAWESLFSSSWPELPVPPAALFGLFCVVCLFVLSIMHNISTNVCVQYSLEYMPRCGLLNHTASMCILFCSKRCEAGRHSRALVAVAKSGARASVSLRR